MIKRTLYINKLLKYLDKPVIKVLTGIRRCGKSTILKLLYDELVTKGTPEENIVFINHESLEFGFIKNYEDLYKFVKGSLKGKKGKKYIILDEVQEVEKWEKAVSSFLSDAVGDIVITGSNAHLLSSELATLLRGRYIEIPVYTLSFSEFLDFRQVEDKNIDDEFKNYLRYGGFPGIHKMDFEDEMIVNYLNSILNTVILKDVIERNSIRDASLVEQIIKYLTDNCGNVSSAKGISDYLKSQNVKVSPDTVINYISYLEKAFMFHKVNRYDLKGKKWLEINNKFYSGDIGLRNGLIGYRENDISGVLENLIYLELIRRGYKVGTGVISGGGEIDFIAEKQNEKIYIQVTYLLASESTVKREFGSLEAINDNYKKIVLSLDKFYPEDRNGIQRQYIPDFCIS